MTPQQLKQIRHKLGLTQAALAVRLGFSGAIMLLELMKKEKENE
jgi:DNA-binding transcriptional regulator YiaG